MKDKQSKLDPHAERLEEWFFVRVPPLTLEEAQKQLLDDGLSVSVSRLSDWHSARADKRREEHVLQMIASGARQTQAIEKQFADNPAPGMETIINLHRVLVMQLATQEKASPQLLALADQLTRTVMEFLSGQTKAKLEFAKLDLAKGRFQRDTCELFIKWAADQRAKNILDGDESNDSKTEKLGTLIFGEDWK